MTASLDGEPWFRIGHRLEDASQARACFMIGFRLTVGTMPS